MELFLPAALFLLGLACIIKGGDLFVDAAAWIAEVSGIPKVIVGATVVSLATTLPEVLVSLMAAFAGKTDMAVGNAVGSVTANSGLILGLSIVLAPFAVRRKDYAVKGGLMLAAVAALMLFSKSGQLTAGGSAVLLGIFALFLWENVSSARRSGPLSPAAAPNRREIGGNTVKFLLGTAGIVIGAHLLVDNGSLLAAALGVPESVIGVTVIAVGTSLPELVTAITAVVKKQGALSAGNILGANIIDTTLILPLCSLTSGQALPISLQGVMLDIPACLLISLLAIVPTLLRRRFSRLQGAAMLALYGSYVAVVVS